MFLSTLTIKIGKKKKEVNFKCRGVLLIWIKVGQGPFAFAEGAGGGCLDIFFLSSIFCLFFSSLSLGDGPI